MKKLLLATLLALPILGICQENTKCANEPTDGKNSVESPSFYEKIIDYSISKIGLRYGRNGFDCSGLVAKAFRTVGIDLPHSCKLQSNFGEKVAKNEAQPGDLIFFSSPKSGKKVGHVGIITSVTEKGIEFVHAAVKGGIKTDFLNTKYYLKHYLMIKRNFFGDNLSFKN